MSSGLIGSSINPAMLGRNEGIQRGNSQVVERVAPVNQPTRDFGQTPELPRSVNRSGPKDMQAMSQYEAFSAQPLAGAGVGFSAVV